MTLQWPFMLPLLALVPILLVLYIGIQRRRRRYALRYASLSLLKEAVGPGPGIRRHIPPALFLFSLTAMIVALARPVAQVQVPSFNGTVILAVDVSGSMRATDIEPSRIEAAKAAARDFVAAQPADVRIGIVAFSGFAALVQQPTTDHGPILDAINQLQPQRSTAIGEGLLTSLRALEPSVTIDAPSQVQGQGAGAAPAAGAGAGQVPLATLGSPGIVVLMSDGQNTIGVDPLRIAPQAKSLGIRVYTVGVGTANGSVLKMFGRSARVRLDDSALRQVAEITNGQYYNAQTDKDLRAIYQNLTKQFGMRTERTELTAYFTGLAAALAVLGGALSLAWFSRLP